MTIKIKLDQGAYMPQRAHVPDAGADLFSPVEAIVYPGCHATIDTGVHMEVPFGYDGTVAAKSGPMKNNGIVTTGTVDSGYTGSIRVTLINTGNDPFVVKKGQKIAQIIIRKVELCDFAEVSSADELSAGERGDGGFGSTGIFWEG
jgi:dUTP pyrophosphatase